MEGRQQAAARKVRQRAVRMAFVDAERASGCVDCGNKNLSVLHSDHVRGRKIMDIGTMVARAVRFKTLFAELAKCETRCANCHMLVTRARLHRAMEGS